MPFPPAFIDEVIARNPIEDVVGQYVTLKRSGSNLFGLCPFHGEKTASFSVAPDKGMFYCFGCHKGGGVINFEMEIEGLSYGDAVRALAKRAGLEVPEDEQYQSRYRQQERLWALHKEAARFFHSCLYAPMGASALEYARGRGMSQTTLTKFGIGYAPDSWSDLVDAMRKKGYTDQELRDSGLVTVSKKNGNLFDRFRDRLMFPIIDVRGNVIGFGGRIMNDRDKNAAKYLNSPETLIFNKRKNLFALNYAKKSKMGYLILVEGYMDAIALHQYGFDCAVASLGTALTDDGAALLSRYTDQVVLIYDGDTAGQNATQRAIPMLEKAGLQVKVLKMRDAKDPDEYIKKYGADRFKALLDGVGNALDFRLGRLRSQYDLKQDAQRLEYVKEAVEMLAQRSNPTEQEVYAGRLAEETNISKTAIMAQLADAVKRAGSKRRWERSRARLREGEMDQIKVPYGAGRGALGMASAEQRLLAAMLREPGYIDKVSARLRPEQFLQPQQKELYEAMLRCREQGVDVSLATLRAFVSEEALNELSRLAAQYSDVNCTPEDIQLYLERIARGTPVASRAASMSTNDIEQYLQSMREQKQGTADAEDSV